MKEKIIVALILIVSVVGVSVAAVVGQEWKQQRIEEGR